MNRRALRDTGLRVHRWSRRRRRRLPGIECEDFTVFEPDQREHSPAHTGREGLRHADRKGGRDGRVDRVPALPKNSRPRLRRGVMR